MLPNYSDRTKLRIISSLVWRVREAQEIGHQVEERKEELLAFVENALVFRETHNDRRMAVRAVRKMEDDNAICLPVVVPRPLP